MEGAVRYTREKIYKFLEMPDPWGITDWLMIKTEKDDY